ncbi:MAG: hypothetical protein ABSG68_13580 [Thermoguttaceae bacterium]
MGHQAAAGERLDEGVQGRLLDLLAVLGVDRLQFPPQFAPLGFGHVAQKLLNPWRFAGLPCCLEPPTDFVDLDELRYG